MDPPLAYSSLQPIAWSQSVISKPSPLISSRRREEASSQGHEVPLCLHSQFSNLQVSYGVPHQKDRSRRNGDSVMQGQIRLSRPAQPKNHGASTGVGDGVGAVVLRLLLCSCRYTRQEQETACCNARSIPHHKPTCFPPQLVPKLPYTPIRHLTKGCPSLLSVLANRANSFIITFDHQSHHIVR